MAITLTVNPPTAPVYSITVPWQSNTNIQQVLEQAYNQQHGTAQPFAFGLQFYGTPPSGYGYMVVMLNNVAEDVTPPEQAYWYLTINDKPATVGIDEYTVNDGDTITFVYEEYSVAQYGSTGYNANKAQAKASTK